MFDNEIEEQIRAHQQANKQKTGEAWWNFKVLGKLPDKDMDFFQAREDFFASLYGGLL